MNLFGSNRTPLLFTQAKLQRNRDGDRSVTLSFKIKLNGNNTRSTPAFVRESYSACKGAQSEAQIDAAIDVQNVEFFQLADSKSAKLKMLAITFDHLRLRKNKDNEIYFYMQTSVSLSKPIGSFILDAYGTEVWATFEEAQGKLIEDDPAESESDEEEGDGELFDGEEEEDEGEPAEEAGEVA